MFLVTLDSLPGYDIKLVLGAVMAAPVIDVAEARRTAYSNVFSGKVSGQIYRDRALQQLVEQAAQFGANAILGLRINSAGVSGTAVQVVPVSPEAVRYYNELARAGHVPPIA